MTIAWTRSARTRSGAGISAILARTSLSPSPLPFFERAAFNSFARSFIAARSSAVNPVFLLFAMVSKGKMIEAGSGSPFGYYGAACDKGASHRFRRTPPAPKTSIATSLQSRQSHQICGNCPHACSFCITESIDITKSFRFAVSVSNRPVDSSCLSVGNHTIYN